jgi:aminocarboxymuconate-semialdehyde decarboxylase
MRNRRNFLKTAASAAAGIVAMSRFPSAIGQAARREVSLGGRRVKVVDIHAHCVIPAVAEIIRGTRLERRLAGNRRLGPERIQYMDEHGVDVEALSANQYWWYAADRDLASRIVKTQDEGIAEWCDAHPERFVGLTSVALQHPDLAADQLEYAVRDLGLRGASIGGHVNGVVPSTDLFDPFWAKAQALDVPVFMHPGGADNVIREGALDGRGDLGNIIGNPLETTVFLSHMIFDGVFDRFPRLKICAAHGGGYLPSYLGRTEVACAVRARAQCANRKQPSEYLRSQIFADTMVFSEEGLRHLVAEMGVGQIVYGTDSPLNWPHTLDVVLGASFLADAEKEAILSGNLRTLLRIDA